MPRLLDIVTELKGDIGARLAMIEARRLENNQDSFVSAGSSTFPAYAESRAVRDRQMKLFSLEDEVIPNPALYTTLQDRYISVWRGQTIGARPTYTAGAGYGI